MKRDQNRIELNVRNGIYDEFRLVDTDAAILLPGSLVDIAGDEGTAYPEVSSQTTDINGFDIAVVIENALTGKGINAKQYPGELLLCRRAVDGDVLLLRAVVGTYYSGQPVYATQTPNGIFVSTSGEGRFIGWCQESYVVTPEMVGLVDDSTPERPSTINLNGVLVNLLRVRIGHVQRVATPPAPPTPPPVRLDYALVADGSANSTSTCLTFTFAGVPSSILEIDNISLAGSNFAVNKGALRQISNSAYELEIIPAGSGEIVVRINQNGITTASKNVDVFQYVAPDLLPIEFAVSANGNETTTSTKVTITFATAPVSDLSVADVILSPTATATKGDLTKISNVVYELAVTTHVAGIVTLGINKTGVSDESALVTLYYVAPVAAVGGYWGVCYPDNRTDGGTAIPTAEEILALTGKTEIDGEKRNMTVSFELNEEDWRAAGGTEDFAQSASGRAFFITKDGWVAESIVTSSFNVNESFDPFTVVLNGVTYSGYIANDSPVVYDGTPYVFTFV